MRNTPNVKAERYRIRDGSMASTSADGNNGAFIVPVSVGVSSYELTVIASDGGGWDHVSVSCRDRCPTWDEMCHIKNMLFRDDEWVMQLHPPKAENISYHDFCLHLWRPQTVEEREVLSHIDDLREFVTPGPIPIPPSIMVAPSKARML